MHNADKKRERRLNRYFTDLDLNPKLNVPTELEAFIMFCYFIDEKSFQKLSRVGTTGTVDAHKT